MYWEGCKNRNALMTTPPSRLSVLCNRLLQRFAAKRKYFDQEFRKFISIYAFPSFKISLNTLVNSGSGAILMISFPFDFCQMEEKITVFQLGYIFEYEFTDGTSFQCPTSLLQFLGEPLRNGYCVIVKLLTQESRQV